MSVPSVQAFFAEHAPDIPVIVTAASTATVAEAAEVHDVLPGQIAKTLCIRANDRVLLLVTRGDARLDNKKAKAAFGGRPRMLDGEEVLALTGHPVGGVCPFGLATPLLVCCDVSLRAFAEVIPAGGAANASVRLPLSRLVELTAAQWVDACELPPPIGRDADGEAG